MSVDATMDPDGRSADSDARPFASGFPLVEAKFHPPTAREGSVRRDALIGRLAVDGRAPLIAIVAPPGYGKTTLLAQWAGADRRRTAWLTVDEHDNDAPVFLTYLATALDRVEPLGEAVANSLAAPGHRVLSTAVPRIASALHAWRGPARVVLDDVHRLTDRTCLDALAELIDHLPGHVRFAIGARMQPGLPLGRLRAEGRLLEIGGPDLAFDERETAAAAVAAGSVLDPEEVHRIHERTEGWPAGVYLGTLRLSEKPLGGPSGDISGRDPYVADYLRSEFLERLPDEDVRLLTRTAILDAVDGAVIDDVAGIPDSMARLAALSDANLLVARLPTADRSYRYHTLLREFLAQELERREPGATPLLHRKAGLAYASHGMSALSIEHALEGGDVERAARMVTAVGLPTFYGGHGGTLDRWLGRFDDAALERHPPLAVLAGWIHVLSGRPAAADRVADIVERASFDAPPGDGTASFDSGRSILQAVMCRRGPDDALAKAEFAVGQEEAASPWRVPALIMCGSAWLLVGDPVRAGEAFADAVDAAAVTGANPMVALADLGLLALRRGQARAAARHVSDAEVALTRGRFGEIASALLVYAAIARVAIVVGEHARARNALARAQVLRPLATYASPWFSVQSLVELARAHLALSDAAGARRLVREAEAIVRVRPAIGTLALELVDVRRQLADEESSIGGATSLTTAELRLLPLLPTYLTFQEIADRLFVSRNTVKTQALSLYGKLGASSRGQAVERAVQLGLIEPFPGLGSTSRGGPGESSPG